MKQETNNEMDLLLRRLGRSNDARVSGAAVHLDADELNAYAENALPQSARARYTEHLSECSRCRALVVQLRSAAGVVSAAESRTVAQPSALRKFLASLFSPMVLRYAAPALGILIVAVIGLVVVQRDRRSPGLALQSEQAKPSTIPVAAEPAVNAPNVSSGEQQARGSAAKVDDTRETKDKEATKTAQPAPSATPEVQQRAEQQPVAGLAEAPPPARPAAKPATSTEDFRRTPEDTGRKQETAVAVAPNEVSKKNIEIDSAERRVVQVQTARGREASKVASPGAAATQSAGGAGRADAEEKRDKDSGAETRSVAGRRFRKQNGIWVDTAYDSRDTINLTRGSEAYRTLVADEPEIKTIADQLSGEIIVVWKGRAYRIR